jgi:hypothetical protein
MALVAQVLAGTLSVPDIDGNALTPLQPSGQAEILFFITHDCPISNFYAPEIQRICSQYGSKRVSCTLVYVDTQMDATAVRKHLTDFGYKGMPAILDAKHKVVDAAGAKFTPEAIVIGHGGKVLYSGRIDNFYAGLGKPRRQVTVHDLRTALEETLAGKPVTTPKTDPVGCYISPAGI